VACGSPPPNHNPEKKPLADHTKLLFVIFFLNERRSVALQLLWIWQRLNDGV
jgi:hypothetical protein